MTVLTTIKPFTSLNRAPAQPGPMPPQSPTLAAPDAGGAGLGASQRHYLAVIVVTGDLVELNELFNLYWRRIIPLGQTSSIVILFSRRLRTENRFSVFMVKEIVRDACFIGFDLYTGEEFFIMDLTLPKQDVVGLMIGFRIFPFDGHWMHTGANLTLGKVRDAQSIMPLGALTSVKKEQNLNDEVIFEWRQMVSEMDE